MEACLFLVVLVDSSLGCEEVSCLLQLGCRLLGRQTELKQLATHVSYRDRGTHTQQQWSLNWARISGNGQ